MKICNARDVAHEFLFVHKNGFMYPSIDETKCIEYGLCKELCSIHYSENLESIKDNSYAVYSKDTYIRNNSSSGGVFNIIAENILGREGVVFGASFNDTFESVHHIAVECVNNLYKIRGSKYLQSDLCGIYEVVKEFLVNNRKVLFSGTPCQIYALKKFLRIDYANLYLIEIACHGVPSQKVWKEYLDYLRKKYDGNEKDVQFRFKNPSWEKILH